MLALKIDWGLKASFLRPCYGFHEFHSLLSYHVPFPLLTIFVLCLLFPFLMPWYSTAAFSFLHLDSLLFCCLKDKLPIRTGRACLSQHRWRKSLFWGGNLSYPLPWCIWSLIFPLDLLQFIFLIITFWNFPFFFPFSSLTPPTNVNFQHLRLFSSRQYVNFS